MKNYILIFFTLFLASTSYAQEDPVLFTVDGKEVLVSEFDYIYSKTNGDTATYSRESLEEYLDLYKKFKLKVAAAREMKLHDIPALQRELAGYRRQLADSYLTDKEVTESLVKEVFDRSKTDLAINHILIAVGEKASPEDTLRRYKKGLTAMAELRATKDFPAMVKKYSDDQLSKERGGSLGYLVAPFPNGFYSLENAAYNTPTGTFKGPIRTQMGYHIIQVTERRKARGEMELAHVLLRVDPKKPNSDVMAKGRCDSLYQVINQGGDFGAIARKFSEDKATAPKDGYIGFIGINRYEKGFEDQAFALRNDGDLSKPVRSSVGYHILKRLSWKGDDPYAVAKRRLQPKIQKDARFTLAKEAMIERIKEEGDYQESPGVLDNWLNGLDASFLTFKWKPATPANPAVIAYFGQGLQRSLNDFEKFCQKNSRQRIRQAGKADPKEVGKDLYKQFTNQMCLDFEESMLESKYPDFKSLMREYEEGILLFEATKMQVWDKASQDTTGLKKFYAVNKENYKWDYRANITSVSVHSGFKRMLKKIRKVAAKKGAKAAMAKFNKGDNTIIALKTKLVEKGRDELLDKMEWEVGKVSGTKEDPKTKHILFYVIDEIIPPATKSLDESRG
ncbi:MAG: peptidyl-prolyl cis-trans isomerase, partial [Saprospiraceae bacterium]|nr:peptidyl-prolyl cis-trans isomerase [Saprospiraceae bacterium]